MYISCGSHFASANISYDIIVEHLHMPSDIYSEPLGDVVVIRLVIDPLSNTIYRNCILKYLIQGADLLLS